MQEAIYVKVDKVCNNLMGLCITVELISGITRTLQYTVERFDMSVKIWSFWRNTLMFHRQLFAGRLKYIADKLGTIIGSNNRLNGFVDEFPFP